MKRLDVVLCHSEVNNRYGTGVLIQRMFPRHREDVVSIRSASIWKGQQEFGARQLVIPEGLDRAAIYSWTLAQTGDFTVRHIYCIPYAGEEITAAIALRDAWQAPLCLYIMDDQNVASSAIPDELMAEAIEKARLRLAISSDMRDAYVAKYDRRFWIAPPTMSGYTAPVSDGVGNPGRGILIGNISTQEWLDALQEATRRTDLAVDWYANSPGGGYWLRPDSIEALRTVGIALHDPLPEQLLAEQLAEYEFALVPTMPPLGKQENYAIAALSLPSRLTFLVGACDLPIIVLGDPDSCVARFVEHFGLGVNCLYEPTALVDAVALTRDASWRQRQRTSLRWLRQVLGRPNIATWLRDSLLHGAPVDGAFESLEVTPRRFVSRYRNESASLGPWLHEYDSVHAALLRLAQAAYVPDFIIDAGAATGAWSHVAHRSFPHARLVLIEPLSLQYEALPATRLTGHFSRLEGFEVYEVALGDDDGEGFMQFKPDLYDSSLVPESFDRSHETLPVPVRRLDSLAGELRLSGRGLINLAFQERQLEVLQGGRDLLATSVDAVILRIAIRSTVGDSPNCDGVDGFLRELGFAMFDEARAWRDPKSGMFLGKDVVFVKVKR